MMSHIFLYGPPGSGKTTVGRLLAVNLNKPFIDLDIEIEKKVGQSIAQIITGQGEPAFRDLESTALERVVTGPPCVIALGGGALLRTANRNCAESAGEIFLLTASVSSLLSRLKNESEQRPLLSGNVKEKLETILAVRESHYGSFVPRITTDEIDPNSIAREIQQRLGLFHVSGVYQGYDIVIQSGGLAKMGKILVEHSLLDKIVVVADSNVAPLYGSTVLESLQNDGCKARLLTIPAGEQIKTIETVSYLWNGFLKAGLDRKSMVLALGGGVTGDLAGFAASTYMRGIRWVCIPTTLLSMVDSSLGGKTGCDLPEGKNLVGTFHSPCLVLSDPSTLVTLPIEELRSGLGEVVKHGVLADPVLFELCSRGFDVVRANITEIVSRAMVVKARIIEADPYEHGIRASLNFGHTIGHALEKASGYSLRHGEAIAIGMVSETRLAERIKVACSGLSETIAVTLQGLGLPIEIPPDLSKEEIINAMQFDKKKDSGVLNFALPAAIGDVRYDMKVEDLGLIF
jgi:shikimate kinase / 3-dehydroquinate synthase